ncbi:MAG: DUF6660 family protein [Ferruginibacter sp.]
MKFLFFLLSFFMIYLSCMPCGDSRECNVKTEIKMAATDNHDHDSHDQEACTPFCSCACCAVSVNFQQAFYTKYQALNFQSFNFLNNAGLPSYNLHSIWQPPKSV